MSDDLFDQSPGKFRQLFFWISSLCATTGAFVGGGEALMKASRLNLLMHTGELWELGFATVVLNGTLAGLCGGTTILLLFPLSRKLPYWKQCRVTFTLGIFLFSLFFLAPLGWEGLRSEQVSRMAAVALLGTSLPVTLWFNAGYWFRRTIIGAGPVVGWRSVSMALGLLLAAISPGAYGVPPAPSGMAAGQANLILITLDTLRRDHLGIYGGLVATPTIDQLGREGLVMEETITPLPETAPSHASMFTGRHPAEHRVTSNGMVLTPGKATLAEHLGLLGYRTGAFVSSFAVDSQSGLSQGYQIYDDDFFPLFRGLGEIEAAHWGLRLLMRFGNPADYSFLLERPAPQTIERALDWSTADSSPMFLWIHLFEAHSPYQRHDGQPDAVDHKAILAQEPGYSYRPEEIQGLKDQYRMEVEYLDSQVKVLLDGLRAAGKLENAVVLLVGDHGESLGEHEIYFNHHGLYDNVLRVPMILWASNPGWTAGQRITGQSSVVDVPNTLLSAAGLPLFSGTHSEALTARAMGAEIKPEAALLLGREGHSLSEGFLYGVRSSNGIKYIQHPDKTEEFYDLTTDPGEGNDLSGEQTKGVMIGRQNVEALRQLGPGEHSELDSATKAMLESLGYLE